MKKVKESKIAVYVRVGSVEQAEGYYVANDDTRCEDDIKNNIYPCQTQEGGYISYSDNDTFQ